jgi:geranylgeranyl pyrophosphate synthase
MMELIDEELRALGPELPWERVLLGPVRDILARPSKRFRANVVDLAWQLGGGHGSAPEVLTAAIEILHAGSLVIDDIEDDAVERRGAPALHRSHGIPVALNAGNWMYFFAFELVDRAALPATTRLEVHRAMLRGVLDCHRGQALDIGHDVTRVARGDLRALVGGATALKAGALTRLAAELGAIAAGADDLRRKAIGDYGAALGTALQMLDDLGVARRLDKAREDLWGLRPTWAWVWTAEHSDEAAWARMTRWARQVAAKHGDVEPLARLLEDFALAAGQTEIKGQLAIARAAVAGLPGAEQADAELSRLEVSFG